MLSDSRTKKVPLMVVALRSFSASALLMGPKYQLGRGGGTRKDEGRGEGVIRERKREEGRERDREMDYSYYYYYTDV